MGAWSYRYDALGNLTSQIDARSCTTALAYDSLSRLTGKSYSGTCGTTTAAITYGYDATTPTGNKGKGKRTSMSDGSGSTTWEYGDSRGRLTKETKTISSVNYVTQWAYDSADQITSMTYPDSEIVSYSYLPQMLINQVGGGTYVQQTWYDAAGRVELRKLGGDLIRTDYNYNAWNTQGGRLEWIKSGPPSGSTVTANLQSLAYYYDQNGNVQAISDALAGTTTQQNNFTYDTLDRLSTAVSTGGTGGTYSTVTYTYDSYGRLLNGPQGTGYTYNSSHKHAVATAGGISYGYDANGNMSSRGGYTFNYDAENRLVSVSGTATASFVYDGDNNRVKGTIGGVTSIYIGNYYEVAGSTVKKYYYAGNQRIAMKSGTTLYWLLSDHLGGTAITVSGTTETGEVRYYPFGADRYTSGTTPTSFKYTGQRQESGIGLYYYGARWYDPALGRFVQPDTIVPDPGDAKSFDRYAYSFNNPLLYSDPDGHRPCAVTSGKCTQRVQINSQSADQLANRLSDLNVSWTNLAANVKSALQEQGIHEGIYNDLGPGATVQTGWRDPATLVATIVGGGRLAWRLPKFLTRGAVAACGDGDCENEYRVYEMAAKRVNSIVSFQRLGGFSRDVLTKGYHLNSEVGEVSLLPQKLADGSIQISVNPAGSTTGTITTSIVQGVTNLLQSDPAGALQRAQGIITTFGSDPRYVERVQQAQLLVEAISSGNYSVVR